MNSVTLEVTLKFEVTFEEIDFEDGKFPPESDVVLGAIEYVADEYLSKRGRMMLEPKLTINPVVPSVKIVT